MNIKNILIIATIIFLVFETAFFPEIAEARGRRGGRGSWGGTIWWIPIFLLGAIVYFIDNKAPRTWDVLGGLCVLGFISFLAAVFLIWIGILNKEYLIHTTALVLNVILFGPWIYGKINCYFRKRENS